MIRDDLQNVESESGGVQREWFCLNSFFPRGSNEEKWNWLESIILIDAQCEEDHQGFCTHLKLKVTSVNHFAWCPLSKRTKWLCKRNEMKLRSTKDNDFVSCTDYGGSTIILKKIQGVFRCASISWFEVVSKSVSQWVIDIFSDFQ